MNNVEFMDGVRLLFSEDNLTFVEAILPSIILLVGIIIAVAYIMEFRRFSIKEKIQYLLLVILAFSGFAMTMYHSINIEYYVILEDDVNFIEFNNKYELIEQKGEIYVIRIKDDNYE